MHAVYISSKVVSILPGPKTLTHKSLNGTMVFQGNSSRGFMGYIKSHIFLQDRISAIAHKISLTGSRIKTVNPNYRGGGGAVAS